MANGLNKTLLEALIQHFVEQGTHLALHAKYHGLDNMVAADVGITTIMYVLSVLYSAHEQKHVNHVVDNINAIKLGSINGYYDKKLEIIRNKSDVVELNNSDKLFLGKSIVEFLTLGFNSDDILQASENHPYVKVLLEYYAKKEIGICIS